MQHRACSEQPTVWAACAERSTRVRTVRAKLAPAHNFESQKVELKYK